MHSIFASHYLESLQKNSTKTSYYLELFAWDTNLQHHKIWEWW